MEVAWPLQGRAPDFPAPRPTPRGLFGDLARVLRDQLHDQLLWPLVSLPAGGEGQEGASPLPPTLAPCPHSQVLALVHVGLAGKGPLQLRGGVRVGSALLWWGQRGLWTQPSCTGWLPTCGTPKSAPTLQTPRAQAGGAHLLPIKSLIPSWNTLVFFEVSPVSFHQVKTVSHKYISAKEHAFQSPSF